MYTIRHLSLNFIWQIFVATFAFAQPSVQLANQLIRESSGVAPSHLLPGVYWTHNDSGDKPQLFAFDSTGAEIGQMTVLGATAIDWEDMASGVLDGEPWLWVADIGDNLAKRDEVVIYGVHEQDPRSATNLSVDRTWRVRYPSSPGNCEALAVDVIGRAMFLFEKTLLPLGRVWRIPLDKGNHTVIAEEVCRVNLPLITAADICPKTSDLILGTYADAFVFRRAKLADGRVEPLDVSMRKLPDLIALPRRTQGEALCFSADGEQLVITTEGTPATCWTIPIPRTEKSLPKVEP